jgi:hypothetical protein
MGPDFGGTSLTLKGRFDSVGSNIVCAFNESYFGMGYIIDELTATCETPAAIPGLMQIALSYNTVDFSRIGEEVFSFYVVESLLDWSPKAFFANSPGQITVTGTIFFEISFVVNAVFLNASAVLCSSQPFMTTMTTSTINLEVSNDGHDYSAPEFAIIRIVRKPKIVNVSPKVGSNKGNCYIQWFGFC